MDSTQAKLRSEMDQLMAVSRDMVHAHGGLTTEEYKEKIADLEARVREVEGDLATTRSFRDELEANLRRQRDKAESALAAARVTIAELTKARDEAVSALVETFKGRCYACGWPFRKDGCEPGNCCFRPGEYAAEHDAWLKRQSFICAVQIQDAAALVARHQAQQ